MHKLSLITEIADLPPALAASVSPAEQGYISEIRRRGLLPFAVTPHFASLARPEPEDPIRRQCIPDPREAQPDPFALDDPLGECHYRVAPRLVHQYRDRALLLAAGNCAGRCRHCFRRVWVSPGPPQAALDELRPAFAYLAAHPEIREILVSGGDPLTMNNDSLHSLLHQLRITSPGLLFRICTRVPVMEPSRLDSETIALFVRFRPLRLVVHINHQRELSAQTRAAFTACTAAGIPVHTQTVLLRGINDNAEVLVQLFRECLDMGLTPYYLFQMDLAPGTAHFRVPLKQGLTLYRELGSLISGLGLPAYAVDLPGGGGKIRLHENIIAGEKETANGTAYILKDANGKEWLYPAR